jgi:uncharacterized protein (TIGR00730 family)
MKIAVYGSSSPRPGDPFYEQAYRLGELLGQGGHTVLTGGYQGTMEAVSKGASEKGAHVIGVTSAEIERWESSRRLNAWVSEERHAETLAQRLDMLVRGSEASIALPGGVGTLTEILFTWNHLVIHAIPPRPLVLIGEGWRDTLAQFIRAQDAHLSVEEVNLLSFVPDVESAVQEVFEMSHHEH